MYVYVYPWGITIQSEPDLTMSQKPCSCSTTTGFISSSSSPTFAKVGIFGFHQAARHACQLRRCEISWLRSGFLVCLAAFRTTPTLIKAGVTRQAHIPSRKYVLRLHHSVTPERQGSLGHHKTFLKCPSWS